MFKQFSLQFSEDEVAGWLNIINVNITDWGPSNLTPGELLRDSLLFARMRLCQEQAVAAQHQALD